MLRLRVRARPFELTPKRTLSKLQLFFSTSTATLRKGACSWIRMSLCWLWLEDFVPGSGVAGRGSVRCPARSGNSNETGTSGLPHRATGGSYGQNRFRIMTHQTSSFDVPRTASPIIGHGSAWTAWKAGTSNETGIRVVSAALSSVEYTILLSAVENQTLSSRRGFFFWLCRLAELLERFSVQALPPDRETYHSGTGGDDTTEPEAVSEDRDCRAPSHGVPKRWTR